MFASINFNLLMSMAIAAGCVVSKAFAAAVIAGALGVFIACLVIFTKRDESSPLMKVRSLLRSLA
jgi:hypothetical protein